MQIAMQRHEHVLTHLSINYFRIFKAPMLLTAIGRKHRFRRIPQSRHLGLPHRCEKLPRLTILNFGLFRDLKSIVDLNTQVSNGGLQLCVAQ